MNDWEHAWRIYQNTQELVRFAETKIRVLLVLAALVVSATLSNLQEILDKGYGWLLILEAIAFVAFIAFVFVEVYARSVKVAPSTSAGLIYFGHVASRKTADDYVSSYESTPEQDRVEDLIRQVYEISKIAHLKFDLCNWALIALCSQACVSIIAIVLVQM